MANNTAYAQATFSGFTITKIVIVQSLEPCEVETGRILSEYISAQISQHGIDIPVEIIKCSCADEFLEILKRLTTQAVTDGEIPLLHVECHGGIKEGLGFENGSTLPWPEVASAILPLNRSSRFNLLAVFSACFGGHFLGQMGAIKPAPCWCVVAPTETVDPGEILNGFRVFYSCLLRDGDMGRAVDAISKCQLSQGYWLSEPAELWYEKLIVGYIETHCKNSVVRARAMKIYQKLQQKNQGESIDELISLIRNRNRESLINDYFNCYFMTAVIPQNLQRFNDVKLRIQHKLSKMRRSGKYVL